jgi:trimethylamine:corrinoid methyltransferase-like protein
MVCRPRPAARVRVNTPSGRRELFNEAREEVDRILRTHQPLPLDEDMERELERIQKKAKEKEGF